jgi:ankyrin repeat protein
MSLQGKELLQAAARNGRPAVLRQLLDMGLDPDARTQIGHHDDQLLLARGADPIESEAEPWLTPLAWAERRQHAAIASILGQHGADR